MNRVRNPQSAIRNLLVIWSGLALLTLGLVATSAGAAGGQLVGVATLGRGHPEVAYNGANDEYLVVWSDGQNLLGQRLFSDSAAPIEPAPFTIVSGGVAFEAQPTLVYNRLHRQYLVVWSDGQNLVGQHLFEFNARPIEGVPFRIATGVGPAVAATLAFDANQGQYLVVWSQGEDLLGQRLYGDSARPIEAFPFAVARNVGIEPNPALAAQSTPDEYLLIWNEGQDLKGQRLRGESARAIEGMSFTVVYGVGNAVQPALAVNLITGQNLLIWNRATEIAGQRLYTTGRPVLGLPFTSLRGVGFRAGPALAFNVRRTEFLAIWAGPGEPIVASGATILGARLFDSGFNILP
jgi:hypothetical protein